MTTVTLEKTWIKFQIQNNNQVKYIFYDTENELIAYHPPFPLSQLSMFIKYYSLNFDEDEFISLLKGIVPNKQLSDSLKGQESTKKKSIAPSVSPITDEESLKKLISIAKQESIEKVIMLAFKIKFEVNPNYQYSEKEKSKRQTCVIKVKDKVVFEGEEKENRALARSSVDLYALQQLAPSKFDEIIEYSSKSKKIPIISPTTKPTKHAKHTKQSKDKNKSDKGYVGQKRTRNINSEAHKNSTSSVIHNSTDKHVSASSTTPPLQPRVIDLGTSTKKTAVNTKSKESSSSESESDSMSLSSSSSLSSSTKSPKEESVEVIEIYDEEDEENYS